MSLNIESSIWEIGTGFHPTMTSLIWSVGVRSV